MLPTSTGSMIVKESQQMYLQNKYTRIYFNIIDRAKSRKLNSYTESHHIIPKSLGGSNNQDNLVDLTAREHFICHSLLVKMTEGIAKRKMSFALWTFRYNKNGKRYVPSSRMYEFMKKQYISVLVGRKLPEEVKEKIRKTNTGKIQSDLTKQKRSQSRYGFRNTEETKHKMSDSAKARWSEVYDDSSRIQKIKDARKNQIIKTIQVTCPHCGKVGGNRIMPRYHFNNCKEILNG